MRAKVWWNFFQRDCPWFSPIQPNSTSASCRWTNIPTVEIFLMFLQSLAWKVIPPIHGLFKRIHSTFGEKPVKVTPKGHQSTWFQIQRRSRLSEICTGQGYFWHEKKKKVANLQKCLVWKRLKETEIVSIESGKSPGERFRQCLSSYFQNGGSTKKRNISPPPHHHKVIRGTYATSTGLDLKR